MRTIDEALTEILRGVKPLPAESVALCAAYGRVLASDLVSSVDVPPWDNSAMDGYALRAADTDAGEVVLKLNEIVGAGQVASAALRPGSATGIMTGAPVPMDADAVVMVEHTDGSREGDVRIRGRAAAGQHIRRRGEDVRVGQVVLTAGTTLTGAAVGLAASLGRVAVPVHRRPVVGILSTGDEIIPPGTPLGPGQIWSSNNASLTGLVLEAGGVPLDMGVVGDTLDEVVNAVGRAIDEADVVLTTGGVSVGFYDVVKEAYQKLGVGIDFWKVKMKPGKPLAYGRARKGERSVPLFGLPGNPVSCMVNFLQFVRPVLRLSLGDPRPFLPVIEAIAGDDFTDGPGRARLLRVTLERGPDRFVARATGSQSSGVLSSMARAHGLLLLGVDEAPPTAGEPVLVQLLDPHFLDGETHGIPA